MTDQEKYPMHIGTHSTSDGGTVVELCWNRNQPQLPGSYMLAMNLQHGGLNCCGVGTIGGFSPYFPHRDIPNLVLPNALRMQDYMHTVIKYMYAETLGIMNNSQYTSFNEFFSALFSYEVIHETINKNHINLGDVKPLKVLKFDRDKTSRRWRTGGEGPDMYLEMIYKRYPSLKGTL